MELKQLIKQQKAKGVLVKTLAHPSGHHGTGLRNGFYLV